MTRGKPTNVAASVRDRLLALSRRQGEDFNLVLVRYGLERLLYRLGRSAYEAQFVLKGAMLFAVWSGHPHRATRDLDLLGSGSPDPERIRGIFGEVCAIEAADGLVFEPASVSAARIKEDAEYEGVRVTLQGRLGFAKLALQVDVGFGDAVTPEPLVVEYPTLLPMSAPRLRAYSRETLVAEKLQAMVYLGAANSRMKDFFDVWFLCRTFAFDGELLQRAIRVTFDRRSTAIPTEPPLALTVAFADEGSKQAQWNAFLSRSGVASTPVSLGEVVSTIAAFLVVPLHAAAGTLPFRASWTPPGPWRVGSP